MAITVAFHQGIQQKVTGTSYGYSTATKPLVGDYVVVIAGIQSGSLPTLSTDNSSNSFSLLQSMSTTGITTVMWGAKINTAPTGNYGFTVSYPSNQAQVFDVIYLRPSSGNHIIVNKGNGVSNISTTTYDSGIIAPTSTSSLLVYSFANNGASAPNDLTAGSTILDQVYTTGKGGTTNVGMGVSKLTLSGSNYDISYNTGTTPATILYNEFGEASNIADTTPPANVTNLQSSNVTSSQVTLTWTAPSDSDLKNYNVYKNGSLLQSGVIGTSFSTSGLTASTSYTFKVTSVDTTGNESSGTSITVTTLSNGTTQPPVPTVGTVTHYKISNETGFTSTDITFTFDQDVQAWSVNVNGSDQNTGTIAGSGSGTVITAGTPITANVDWTELYQEGQNKVNIYGQNTSGVWTSFQSDNTGTQTGGGISPS